MDTRHPADPFPPKTSPRIKDQDLQVRELRDIDTVTDDKGRLLGEPQFWRYPDPAHTPIPVKWAIERQGRGLPHPDGSNREPTHARSVYRSITQFTLCDAHQPPIGMKASALAGASVWIALASYEAQTQLGTRRRP